MGVRMRQQFIRLLRRCVQADRMVNAVMFAERRLGVGAVDTGTARVYEMLDGPVAACFQNVRKRDKIVLDVVLRM